MTVRRCAEDVAADLLRTALMAKLAVDLHEPRAARRAARHATEHARLLAGLDFTGVEEGDDDADLDELLRRRYPPTGDGAAQDLDES